MKSILINLLHKREYPIKRKHQRVGVPEKHEGISRLQDSLSFTNFDYRLACRTGFISFFLPFAGEREGKWEARASNPWRVTRVPRSPRAHLHSLESAKEKYACSAG